jgi:asparagine synthase (glutamine-hydrolysing)
MCGIFGAVWVPAEQVDVEAALEAIAHRGPDASGVWRRGSTIVLGHRRLAILDLTPNGAQPMASEDGETVVVFNGEIYNHHDLRQELSTLGHRFRSRSDTEVIVEGYRAWGDGIVDRLDGMFAFGLWDGVRERLLLSRDRAGKKPLFFAPTPRGGIRFASEIKALLASGFAAEPNLAALPALLSFGYTPAPRSMIRGVEQLAPASLVVVEQGIPFVQRRYWRAPFGRPPLRISTNEATLEVRRLVEAAVQRRLEADVPLGAFLSGGIDSSIIVGVMARLTGRPVKTFSIGFSGDPRFDETRYARLAARAFGTEHVEFTLDPTSFDQVDRLVELHDGPFGDSSAIPTSVVSRLTRQHVTVAMTGDGGDELFAGYYRFLAAEAAEWIPAPLRRVGARLAALAPHGANERTSMARATRFARAAALPLSDRLARWVSLFAFELDQIVRRDLRRSLPLEEPRQWMSQVVEATVGARPLARILDHNFETYLPYDLLVKADRASMGHGLETRSPFLDTALVEFVAQLPSHFKRRGLTTKWILRRAFADLLPPEIMRRGKMGFGIPLGAWFRGDLKNYVKDQLGAGARVYEYLEPLFVSRMVDDHLAGAADHGHRIWLLLTLEVWLRSLERRAHSCAA